MRKLKKGKKLSRDLGHRRALRKNLAAQLFQHEEIKTTLPKAKWLRPYAEKLITKARSGDLQNLSKLVPDTKILKKLLEEIGPRFKNRAGGYTQIFKLGPRRGDSAENAIIRLVDRENPIKK